MKKVIVIGCPGSGKSTFSKALHQKSGLPLVHLDRLYWNADKTTVEKAAFLQRLAAALQGDVWIIDGNYASTMEQRMQACDTVIFLDYPVEVCLDGLQARRGTLRSDMPWAQPDTYDEEFEAFVKNYATDSRPQVVELLQRYADKCVVVFQSRAEADAFLAAL